MKYFLLLTALLQLQWQALSVENQFISPVNATCACPGEVLTYTCLVVGGRATIWGGTAFDCAGNEITLRHDNLIELGKCNNGAILGQNIDVSGTYYTSQLKVTVSNEINNRVVTCSSDSMMYIGESLIKVAVRSAPDYLYLADAQKEKLLFSWTSTTLNDCSSPMYNITSDCGTCTITNMTTATCSDLQLTTNARLCHFSISSVVCDQIGNPSSPVSVTLKVPNVPQVKFVPSYSSDGQALEALFIVMTVNQNEDLFLISDNIPGSPTSYTAHAYASNFISSSSFDSTLDFTSCKESNGCRIVLPSSFYCPQSTTMSVTISAANKLGEGPHSNPFMIECTNNFVQVVYNETSSELTISCIFLNQSDTSHKRCCVTNQLCDQKGLQNDQVCNKDFFYRNELKVSGHSGQHYCYTVTASNDTYTVKVEGSFTTGLDHPVNISPDPNTQGAIVAIIIIAILIALSIIIALSFVIIIIIVIVRKLRQKLRNDQHLINQQQNDEDSLTLEQYLTHYDLPTALKLHKVRKDRELREYVTKTLSVEFRRGHTYYEFTNDVENIQEGKEVLLQDKNTRKWFQLAQPEQVGAERHKLYGEGIPRERFGERYRVYVQSFGSGARHLPRGTCILYDHSDNQVQPDVLPLVAVCSDHFAHKVFDSEEGCPVEQFCRQNGLNPKAFNLFLTVEHHQNPEGMRDQSPRDVILMDKNSELFTGPRAREMLDSRNGPGDELQHKNEKWKVFVLMEKNKEGLTLKKGCEVLCQDVMYRTGSYALLEADEDCVRMSKFIETKLDCKFEDGKAFYEVTENDSEEDLLHYKKVLRPQTNELSREELKLQSLVEYFYATDGVPAKAVKPDKLNAGLQYCKVFIQSTSQGSRCLRKGTKILYLQEVLPEDIDSDDGQKFRPLKQN